jgi:hypothetical protein
MSRGGDATASQLEGEMAKVKYERRAKAARLASDIRYSVPCARCGAFPIEFHRDEHVNFPYKRICHMVSRGAFLDEIINEIRLCSPLCRSCHMKVDGRGSALTANRPLKRGSLLSKPAQCKKCDTIYKPLRRGMCANCYDHFRRSTGGMVVSRRNNSETLRNLYQNNLTIGGEL